MKSRFSLLFVLLMALLLGNNAMAQISYGGTPASFAFPNASVLRSSDAQVSVPIQFNVDRLLADDKIAEANHVPLRTAVIIPVELDAQKSGVWTTLPSGQQVWRLTIAAPNAIALMLYYDQFVIPEGGKLFIYNEEQTHLIGSYTSKTNPTDGAFATEFVAGDKITLEYNAPFNAASALLRENVFSIKPEIPQIKISGVGYGYNYLKVERKIGGLLKVGESESCEVNINCPEGANWQDEKKGVARSITPIGTSSFLCSGTLVNNTRQDLIPYFLTASHCFWNGTATLTAANWNQIVYYFHYESQGCTTALPTGTRTITGAQMLVELRTNGSSDGALLRLSGTIPLGWDLYFNGWDRRNIAATSGVGIHHPAGDIKKISTYTTPATQTTWNGSGSVGATNAHWNITFAQTVSGWGVTEGGSSGSPMFNQNKLVVGTLTGGNSDCTNLTGRNIYGKFWYHWDNANQATATGANTALRVRDYLDPDNTGVETLNGTYTVNNQPVADFTASSTNIYVLESITYTNISVSATSWEWDFQGGTPATFSGKNPPAIVYNTQGNFTTTLRVNGGTGPQETKTVNINVTVKGTPTQPVADFNLPTVTFREGFDSSPFSSDWTVQEYTNNTGAPKWTIGNVPNNFNSIVPSSLSSAIVPWNVIGTDTWLITANSYPIQNNFSIEFYAGYSGSYLSYATLYFKVSADGGTTWTQLWTAGTTNITRSWSWTKYSFDLSAYNGQNLKFAWQYVGADGDMGGLDGVRLSGPSTSTTINVGDFLKPIDLSTGTPVLWDWTFNGATPVNASGQEPIVQYMTVGVYDITLTVRNTVGTDTKTVTNAVTVVDQVAMPEFTSSSPGGYTMRENFGIYIAPNNSVTFKDVTKNYPLTWAWDFTGGNPAGSTVQNPPNVLYSAAGLYNVALTTSNTAGTQTKTTTGYVKAGFNDPTRIWNIMYGENITAYSSGSNGVFGSNTLGISMFSERFDAPSIGGYISAVDLKALKAANATGNLTIAVFTDNGGIPGTQIGANVTLAINTIPTATTVTGLNYTTVTFTPPILVSGAFHIRVSGLPTSNASGLRFASALSRGALAKNTAYLYYSSAWRPTSGVFADVNTSLDIVPYFAYTANNDVNFDAQSGYVLKSNYNPFIPVDGTMRFTDLTAGFPPVTWNWTLNGATPATSTLQHPQVVYTTAGNHDVSLAVTNALSGTGSLTKTAFIKAMNNEYNPHWNMNRGEDTAVVYNWGASGNYVAGTNTVGLTAFAERFVAPVASGLINGVGIRYYRTATAPSGTLTISLARDENGFPGAILASSTQAANNIGTTTGTYLVYTNFATPVLVSGAYHIVISGFSGASTGGVRNLSICSTADRGMGGKNTFSYFDGGTWYDSGDDVQLFTSLNVAPRFAYTNQMEADFGAENGYTRQCSYGRFIPTGYDINFYDLTNGIPTIWNWDFTGGTPATSTVANPVITYNTTGDYPVSFAATNAAGVTSTKAVSDYVKAGFNVPDRIWNMLPGDAGVRLHDIGSGYGYFTGAHVLQDIAFAERFDAPLEAGFVDKVDIRFNTAAIGTLDVSIRKEENGEPGQILQSKTLNTGNINATDYTTVVFDNPAYTDGAFYVVVSGFDAYAPGAIGLLASEILSPSAKNTAYVLDMFNDWQPLLESWGYSNALSLNIAPTFTYIVPSFSINGALSVARKDIDATVETVTVTSSLPWTATSTASWVNITVNSATEFEYTVSTNTTSYPRVAKIIVGPTGLDMMQKVILVRQACTHPTGLTAAFNASGAVQVDWNALVFNAPATLPVDNQRLAPTIKKASGDLSILGLETSANYTSLKSSELRSKAKRTFMIEGETEVQPASTGGGKGVQETSFTPSSAKSSLRAAPAQTVVRWDDGSNYDAIGFQGSAQNIQMEVATLFTPADLTLQTLPSGISKIKEVEFYIQELPLGSIMLKIRQGRIVYRQEVCCSNLTPNAFNTVVLDNPFILDNVSDTYIGYELFVDAGMYVPGLDFGPANPGKGDLIGQGGGPLSSLQAITSGLISGNWNIAAKIETGKFDNYIVYRNNVEIARTTNDTYTDQSTLTFGQYFYKVTALYDDPVLGDLESTPSNEDDVFKLSPENSLFSISPASSLVFAAVGEDKDITVTVNDPMGYITTYGYYFRFDMPSWISSMTNVGNVYTFTADPNTSGVVRTGVIRIWLTNSSSVPFSTDNGFEVAISQKSVLLASMLDYSFANVVYNGAAQPVSVTLNAAYSGLGAITVLYDGSSTPPVYAGTYIISISALSGVNFDAITDLTLASMYTIDPAPLTIRPNDVTRPYGTLNPAFTVSYSTLLGADTPASISGLVVTTTATQTSPPGTYPITANYGVNPNYVITYVDGWLTIERIDQYISFPSLPNLYVGDSIVAYATSSVGLPVTYTSSDPSIATVTSNGKIRAISAGTVIITAKSSGNSTFLPMENSCMLTVLAKPTEPDPDTGSEYVNGSQAVTVYPNPVSKSASVYVSANLDEAKLTGAIITVYTEAGSLVKNVQVTGKLTKVDLSVEAGSYLFVLKGKDGIIKSIKVIVQ